MYTINKPLLYIRDNPFSSISSLNANGPIKENDEFVSKEIAVELLVALKVIKGVMPFHDGEYTEGESQAMFLLDKAITNAEK